MKFIQQLNGNVEIYREKTTHKVFLYDANNNLKSAERHESEHLAWASGENWKMVRAGNRYEIKESV